MKTNSKLKVLPGRGLSGRDIKTRMKNRTLTGQVPHEDQYLIDEEMGKFMKMSAVERISAIRSNNARLNEIQTKINNETNARKAKQQENEIELKVQERLKQIRNDQSQSPENV